MQERERAVDFVLRRTAGLAQVSDDAATLASVPNVVTMMPRSQLGDARRG